MKKTYLLLIVPVMVLLFLTILSFGEKQMPSSSFISPEVQSPSDWIKESQIKVYDDKIVLGIENATWASFTDTNSMDPFIDEDSNAIEVKPSDPDSINPGDVISYQTEYGVIIHRVIEKGVDERGVYYTVKGDNNGFADPFKVRFGQVKGVVVAVVYWRLYTLCNLLRKDM